MRKYGINMKCAFISVLMNLIYGEGPVRNFLPSKSAFKSAIHLCYLAVIITPLFILKYWTNSDMICVFQLSHSVTEMLWNIIWKFSPNDSHEWSLNQENIFVIKKCGYINLFCGRSPTPVLSLEHLIKMTHTGLLQSIHGPPSFPPAALIPGGRGRLHPAFCQLEFG